eukprot:COSAG01_NODE_5861_length_3985_cov_4.335821_1_plen_59_part_00
MDPSDIWTRSTAQSLKASGRNSLEGLGCRLGVQGKGGRAHQVWWGRELRCTLTVARIG